MSAPVTNPCAFGSASRGDCCAGQGWCSDSMVSFSSVRRAATRDAVTIPGRLPPARRPACLVVVVLADTCVG
jgi:hypothetical protein